MLEKFLLWESSLLLHVTNEEIAIKHGFGEILAIEKLSIIQKLKQGKTKDEITNSLQKQDSEDYL